MIRRTACLAILALSASWSAAADYYGTYTTESFPLPNCSIVAMAPYWSSLYFDGSISTSVDSMIQQSVRELGESAKKDGYNAVTGLKIFWVGGASEGEFRQAGSRYKGMLVAGTAQIMGTAVKLQCK